MDTTIERAQLECMKRMTETMERIEALLVSAEKDRRKVLASFSPMPRLTCKESATPRAPK
jgi:hypothetical protein